MRVPCVGLTIVGGLNDSAILLLTVIIFADCDIRFYAMVAIDYRLRLVNPTPAFSCTFRCDEGAKSHAGPLLPLPADQHASNWTKYQFPVHLVRYLKQAVRGRRYSRLDVATHLRIPILYQ